MTLMLALIILTVAAGLLLFLAIYIGWAEGKENGTGQPSMGGAERSDVAERPAEGVESERQEDRGTHGVESMGVADRLRFDLAEYLNARDAVLWGSSTVKGFAVDEEGESEEQDQDEYGPEGEYELEDEEEPEGQELIGAPRGTLAALLKEKYESGASVQMLAAETGRSVGFVHRMLSESGVTLRGRPQRRSRPAKRVMSTRELGEEGRRLLGWLEEDSESHRPKRAP